MRALVLLLLVAAMPPLGAQPLPEPAYAAYDVFVVAGQSNARGRGDSTLSAVVPEGAAYEAKPDGRVGPLADPVGGANTGSAWTAFANAYSSATGQGVAIIGMATNGSAQVALPGDDPSQTWDLSVSDNLYERAQPKVRRAMEALRDRGFFVRIRGWLWIQGGADGRRIDEGTLTPEAYRDGLHALAARVDADYSVPLFLFMTGTDARGDTDGIAAVRTIQADADALDEVVVVYRDAVSFPARGWMLPDNVHWSQAGLDDAGRVGGEAVAAWVLAQPPETAPGPPLIPSPAPPEGEPGEPDPPGVLTVYPNPASGVATVDLACTFRYDVTDTRGRRIARGQGDGPTDLPPLASGLYVVRAWPQGDADASCAGRRTLTIVR